jgi:hypothetical protein
MNPSPANQNSLIPFSAEALDELYAKGPTLKPGETISWHVEFLNKTLRCALDDHYAGLAERVRINGEAILKSLNPNERIIRAEHIQRARKIINKT